MKKANTSVVVALLTVLFSQLSYSQVKRQYQDQLFAETTVVIKEDTVNDLDLLNAQFDMDDFGMGQVIRITTEQDRQVLVNQKLDVVEAVIAIPVEEAEAPAPIITSVALGAPAVQKQSQSRTKGGNYTVKSKVYAGNWSNKRLKNKKGTIKMKGKSRCYKF